MGVEIFFVACALTSRLYNRYVVSATSFNIRYAELACTETPFSSSFAVRLLAYIAARDGY